MMMHSNVFIKNSNLNLKLNASKQKYEAKRFYCSVEIDQKNY
jgi:hypothetical protein